MNYQQLTELSELHNERADCVVRALALATGLGYEWALEECAKHGRKKRRGMYEDDWKPMFRKHVKLDHNRHLSSYKTISSLEKSLAKQHPERMFLIRSTRHVSVWKGGQLVDWASGRRKKVIKVWDINFPEDDE